MDLFLNSYSLAFINGIGTMELVIIFLVVLLIFGPKKLPELARGIGKSIKEFKKSANEIEDDIKTVIDDSETNKTQSTAGASDANSAQRTEETKTTS